MRNQHLVALASSLLLVPLALASGCKQSVTIDANGGSGGTGTSTVDEDADGYTADVDCDDHDAAVHPGQQEPCVCDGIDQDCSGVVDDFPCYLACEDADGDGYPVGIDCDDADATVHPDQEEPCACDGIDQNCNGAVDDFPCDLACLDQDNDGYPQGVDCDDFDPTVFPSTDPEPCVCDGVDSNCNGIVDDFPCAIPCEYLQEGALCVPGQEPACGAGLSCCYPCGVEGCDDVCTPTCDSADPGCFDGCMMMA